MIVYGYRTKGIKTEPLPYEKCPSCGHEGAMTMNIFSSYAHIFWIPLFPYRKFGVAHCNNCNATFEKKQMDDNLKRELANVKEMVRHPVWTFAGLMAIGVLVVWGVYSSKESDKKNKAYITAPIVGDMYTVKVDEGYTIAKVFFVNDSFVGLQTMDFVATKRRGLYKLEEKEYTDSILLLKNDLVSMFDEGTITDIDR